MEINGKVLDSLLSTYDAILLLVEEIDCHRRPLRLQFKEKIKGNNRSLCLVPTGRPSLVFPSNGVWRYINLALTFVFPPGSHIRL